MEEFNLEQINNDWEQKKSEIDQKIEVLDKKRFAYKDYLQLQQYIENIEGLTQDQLFHARLLDIIQKRSILKLETLPEFKYALEKLPNTSKEWRTEMLAHENAHANVADKLGVEHFDYSLIFLEGKDEEKLYIPQASHINPEMIEGWTKQRQNEANLEITQAPEVYGGRLSESDKKEIEKIIMEHK